MVDLNMELMVHQIPHTEIYYFGVWDMHRSFRVPVDRDSKKRVPKFRNKSTSLSQTRR
jgi:hypothetical protein